MDIPLEMFNFLILGTKPVVLRKEAPEEFKEEARRTNEEYMKYAGYPFYEIEE